MYVDTGLLGILLQNPDKFWQLTTSLTFLQRHHTNLFVPPHASRHHGLRFRRKRTLLHIDASRNTPQIGTAANSLATREKLASLQGLHKGNTRGSSSSKLSTLFSSCVKTSFNGQAMDEASLRLRGGCIRTHVPPFCSSMIHNTIKKRQLRLVEHYSNLDIASLHPPWPCNAMQQVQTCTYVQ